MKKVPVIICILLHNLCGFAQDCTKENVGTIPGKWKQGMRGASDHSAADMVKEKALMDDVIQTIRTNFTWQPVGGEISYGNAYSIRGLDYRPSPVIKICNQYYPFIFYQHYFCADGKINREDYSVSVSAFVNDVPFKFPYTFFESRKDKLGYNIDKDPETDKYDLIDYLPEVKSDMIEYKKNDANIYRILTKHGQAPFVPMSKKENYEKWKIKYAKIKEQQEAMKLKYAQGTDAADNQSNIKMCDAGIAVTNGFISKIDAILTSKSAAALAMPAFSLEETGEYFESSTREDPHQYVIKPNLAYYNNKLPKSSPQVIAINFSFSFTKDKYGDVHYADDAFYKELERIKIIDLLTAKLQPLIEQ